MTLYYNVTLHSVECCYAACHYLAIYAECRYAECHNSECRGAIVFNECLVICVKAIALHEGNQYLSISKGQTNYRDPGPVS